MPRSNQERIVFDDGVSPDEFFSYEREWENREYIPSSDQGKSLVMPTRRTTVIAKT